MIKKIIFITAVAFLTSFVFAEAKVKVKVEDKDKDKDKTEVSKYSESFKCSSYSRITVEADDDIEEHETISKSENRGVRNITIIGDTTFSTTESQMYLEGKLVSERVSQRKTIKTIISDKKYQMDSTIKSISIPVDSEAFEFDDGKEYTYSEIYEILEDGTEMLIEHSYDGDEMEPVEVRSKQMIFSDGSKISSAFTDQPYKYKNNDTNYTVHFENSSCYYERLK